MKRILTVLTMALLSVCGSVAGASGQAENKPKGQPAEVPKSEQSVTQHKIVIGGSAINYSATAGTLIVRNTQDQPYASMGYTAYKKSEVADPSRRPITFAYNGGPGDIGIGCLN